jgi:isoprenylcysteine carboxyl methyltransferase (ICMT) family protein YpbQ
MAGGMTLISSEILCLRLCKSAGRAWNTLLYIQPHEKKSQADRPTEQAGQEMLP